MLQVYLCMFLMIGIVQGNPQVTRYFDIILTTFRMNDNIQKDLVLHIHHLRNFNVSFEENVKGTGRVQVLAEYTYGKTYGLANPPKRPADCEPPFYTSSGKTLRCNLVLNNIKVEYERNKVSYGNMPKVHFKAEATVPKILLSVDINSDKLVKVSFTNIENLTDMKFSGLGPMTMFEKALGDKFKSTVKGKQLEEARILFESLFYMAAEFVPFPESVFGLSGVS